MFDPTTTHAKSISGKYPTRFPGKGFSVLPVPPPPPIVYPETFMDTFTIAAPLPGNVLVNAVCFANGAQITGTYEPPVLSQADIVAGDVILGKIAYGLDGVEITGTLDLTEGDIVEGDVILGKIGYGLDGAKITGTLDLTEADIVAGDVAIGKIAYGANGVKIIGTAE